MVVAKLRQRRNSVWKDRQNKKQTLEYNHIYLSQSSCKGPLVVSLAATPTRLIDCLFEYKTYEEILWAKLKYFCVKERERWKLASTVL
jgi:hypothetical protein